MARRKLKSCLLHVSYGLRLDAVARLLRRKRTSILMYHGFTDKSHEGIENYQGKHLNIDSFESQMEHVARHYNIIPLERLISYYDAAAEIPDHSVVITMDDGYESNFVLAYPVLKRLELPATIFLATEFVDEKQFLWTDRLEYAINKSHDRIQVQTEGRLMSFDTDGNAAKASCDRQLRSRLKVQHPSSIAGVVASVETHVGHRLPDANVVPTMYRPLDWGEIREMVCSGLISIGSHTCSHAILTRLTEDEARRELLLSRKVIAENTGLESRLFCYPNGGPGDFSEHTRELLKDTGYACGLTTLPGMNDKYADVFALRRVATGSGGLEEFVLRISGAVQILSNASRRLGSAATGVRT